MNNKLRELILEKSYNAKVGHIGSSLSICDLVWCVYDSVLDIKPDDFDGTKNNARDRFILSKGHAGLALYIVLFLKNFISKEKLDSYCDHHGTYFPAHPKHYIRGVEFSTGSLGQGITFAVGEALAAKIQKSNRKIYTLISDGEINEGSCWEAFMSASQHKLNNLIVMYDNNHLQVLGKTDNVLSNYNIEEKIKAFGFDVHTVDGHNHKEIKQMLVDVNTKIHNNIITKPIFINAKTILGKGVSFMEDQFEWHSKAMNQEQYELGLKELNI